MRSLLLRLLSAALILTMVLTSVDIACFDRDFYESEYSKLAVAQSIDIELADLMDVTDVLLDYTKGDRADMVVEKVVSGAQREVFNDREKSHMADVAALYQNAMLVRNICFIGVILGIIYLIVSKADHKEVLKSYTQVSLMFLLLLSLLIMIALVDFNWFWTNFHHVFFTNDLWLLDPNTDILIMMVPERFFYDLVLRIIALFIAMFGSSNALAYYFYKRKDKGRII